MESTHPLIAIKFSGPAHPLPVVRLVSEPIMSAETTMLGLFGLHPDAQRAVGTSTQHAVGFPAWPIMTDPDNAHHALNLVAELEQIRRRPSLRRARMRINAVTAQLAASAPHFAPTFLEEVARIFVTVGNRQAARQFFGKARAVERAHKVAIDLERHQAACVEFAHAGVVGAAELVAECRAVGTRDGDAKQGFTYALGLVHAQARAGVCPSTGVVVALRQLGHLAGMTPAEVDQALVAGLLGLTVLTKAPTKLFVVLAEALKQHPEVLEVLWGVKPRKTKPLHFLRLWHAAGLLEFMHTDRGRYAQWLVDFINTYSSDDTMCEYSAVLEEELAYCGDALRGLHVHRNFIWMPLNVIDLLCEYGVSWDTKGVDIGNDEVDWVYWLEDEHAENRRPLLHAARHKDICRYFIEGICSFEVEEYLDVFFSHEGARELLGKKIDELANASGDIVNNNEIIDDWSFLAVPKVYDVYGARVEKLFSHNADELLATALHAGTIAELTWPAYEQAVARVRSKSKQNDFSVFDSFPAMAVVSGTYVEMVDGDVTIASGELPARYENIHSIFTVGDKVQVYLTLHNQSDDHLMWLGDTQIYPADDSRWGYDGCSLPLPDGTRLTAFGLLQPTELKFGLYGFGNIFATNKEDSPIFASISYGSELMLWDGASYEKWEGTTKEALEKLGAFSYGLDVSDIPDDSKIMDGSSTIIPAYPTTKNSLLGTAGGNHVYIQYKYNNDYYIVSPHGTFKDNNDVRGVIPKPGGGKWLACDDATPWRDAETGVMIALQDKDSIFQNIPFSAFHQFHYRDEQASRFMRTYSCAQARRVIDAGTDSEAYSILSTQLGTTDEVLLNELMATQRTICKQAEKLQALIKQLTQSVAAPDISISESAAKLLYLYLNRQSFVSLNTILRDVQLIASFIADPDNFSALVSNEIDSDWIELMHNERFIIGMLGSPLLPQLYKKDNAFTELVNFFRAATKLGIFGCGWRRASVDIGTYESVEYSADILPHGSVVEGCLVLDSKYDWNGNKCRISRIILTPDNREKVGDYTVKYSHDLGMNAENFLTCLDAISETSNRTLNEDAIKKIYQGTGLIPATIRYIFGGMEHDNDYTPSSGYKFTTAEEAVTKIYLCFLANECLDHFSENNNDDQSLPGFLQLLAHAEPQTDPVSYIHQGPDTVSIISYWQEKLGKPGIHISADMHYKILVDSHATLHSPWYRPAYEIIFNRPELNPSSWPPFYRDHLAIYLHLAQNLELNDPGRPFVAHKLTWLRESAEKNLKNSDYFATVPFGSSFTDPGFTGDKHPDVQAIRLLMDGHLDAYIADLSIVHDVEGCPWDPAVSAPEVVNHAATQLNISHDAARYYLQVLGLICPTDADIRRWNNWNASTHRAAVAELADRGLIVEGHRARAGRSWFLPGAWLEGRKKDRPVEEWKARHYLLWQDVKVRPVLPGSPLLMPIAQLYQRVWQRYIAGDVPGYVELRTKKYRPRKNR